MKTFLKGRVRLFQWAGGQSEQLLHSCTLCWAWGGGSGLWCGDRPWLPGLVGCRASAAAAGGRRPSAAGPADGGTGSPRKGAERDAGHAFGAAGSSGWGEAGS